MVHVNCTLLHYVYYTVYYGPDMFSARCPAQDNYALNVVHVKCTLLCYVA